MDTTDSVENDFVKFWLENNIIYAVLKKDCILSLNAAIESVEMRLKFQKGRIYKALIYITHIGIVSEDARKYLSKEGCEGFEKAALITNSTMSTIVGNLFIMVNKPLLPTKLFRNKEEALKWLNQE